MGHDLYGVIGVVVGGVAEEVVGTPRATGPSHLQAHRGEPGHPRQHGSDVRRRVGEQIRIAAIRARGSGRLGQQGGDGIGGTSGVIARVFDDGRAWSGGAARATVGIPHRGSQLDAVTHGDVVEPRMHGLVGVEIRIDRRVRTRGQHRERRGLLPGGRVVPGVARARREIADDQRAEVVGGAGIGRVRHPHSLA